jgi:hypothetical protein
VAPISSLDARPGAARGSRGSLVPVQPIEDCAFAGAEGFVTRVADEALLLTRMDTNIALASQASGRANRAITDSVG